MNSVKRHFDLLFAIVLAIGFAAVVWATRQQLGESILLAGAFGCAWLLVFSIRESNQLHRETRPLALDTGPEAHERAPLYIRYYGLILAILFASALCGSAIVFGIPLGETILLGLPVLALWATAWAEGPPRILTGDRWPT